MTTEMLSLRVVQLREAYLQAKPFVSAHRAVSVTQVYEDNPGMNNSLLRALAFRRACETAKSAGAGWPTSCKPFPRGRRTLIRLMRKQSVCFAKKYSHTGRAVPSMKWRKRS